MMWCFSGSLTPGPQRSLFQGLLPFPTALRIRELALSPCLELEAHYVNYTHLEELRATTKDYCLARDLLDPGRPALRQHLLPSA